MYQSARKSLISWNSLGGNYLIEIEAKLMSQKRIWLKAKLIPMMLVKVLAFAKPADGQSGHLVQLLVALEYQWERERL